MKMNIVCLTGHIPFIKRVMVLNYGLVNDERDLNGKLGMVVELILLPRQKDI